MDTNFNSVLDLSRLDYIFYKPEEKPKKEIDLSKFIYGKEQFLEKYIKKQLELLPMERYDYLFNNLDDDITYVLTIQP